MDTVSIVFISIISLILLSIPVMIIVSVIQLGRRSKEMQAFAAGHGYNFTRRERLPDDLRDLPYFRNGVQINFRRYIKNVLRREHNGIDTMVFDYWYLNVSGVTLPTSRTARASVVCLRRGHASPWQVSSMEDFVYPDFSQVLDLLKQSMKELHKHDL